MLITMNVNLGTRNTIKLSDKFHIEKLEGSKEFQGPTDNLRIKYAEAKSGPKITSH